MPDTNGPVQGTPSLPYQPWEATSDATVGKWVCVKEAGAADSSGNISGGWPGNGTSDGSAWVQT